MPIYDISRSIQASMAVWPGDQAVEIKQLLELEQGDSVNLTRLIISAHSGTHADAPSHFIIDGDTMEQMPLETYWGAAQVVTVDRGDGPLTAADFAGYDLTKAPRVLVRSHASSKRQPHDQFPDSYVYPASELGNWLAAQGIILYGADAPSMDSVNSKDLLGHHGIGQNNIAILEWLDLADVADGIYELVALPLRITGGDGSPIRAVLRSKE